MHQVLRTVMSAGGALALAAAAAGCSDAGASQTMAARGGAETLVLTTRSSAPDPVYAIAVTGVFRAKGTVSGIGSGKNLSLVKLPAGTFEISHPVRAEKITPQSVNHRTCAVLLTQTGSFTLSKGTGEYLGISGYGTDHGMFTATLPRRKNGTCETSDDVAPMTGSVHVIVRAPATILIPPAKSG